ncbi:hypothetical protein Golax_007720 [Gossypium laxum]|uniref:Protein BYPASS-related n=2 Tax=Gossypium TaxID=3633 RepID=A0A7J8XV09_GOSAI|nr:hypothetical protein [Gossypium aridum]MBA0720081.1 hypothetical protein [Gossypium laxum]
MDTQEQELEDIELFQKHVSDRFTELSSPPEDDALLSVSWLHRLLDVFLCCEAEFEAILIMDRDPSQLSKPPFDRLIPEFIERAVKALDICNAVANGVDSVRHCQKLSEIVISALDQNPLGDGHAKRAKKALLMLLSAMNLDDKEGTHVKATERSWSFGRRGVNKEQIAGHFRSLSWQVAKNWSSAKQIQSMIYNLVAPRGAEASGLPSPIYTMNVIMIFVMWAMVAAIPCQERNGLPTHFPVPKQLNWAHSLIGLQEKIADEWKKKEKKGMSGLLDELQKMEKLAQSLMDFTDSFHFPGDAEKVKEAAANVSELKEIFRRMDQGLTPLQMHIREVFHRIVRSRTEFLDVLEKGSAPAL